MDDRAASAVPRVAAAAWIAPIALALLARLAFVAALPREILWRDGREFETIARSILAHHGYGLQTLRPPGYPTFIAGVYALFGPSILALRLVEALLATAAVGVVAVVGGRRFGPLAGWIAAMLMALHPVLALLPSTQYSENVLVLMLVLAFTATDAAWARGGLARWGLAGALLGIAALVRPNAVLLLPGLALGLLAALRGERRPWLLPGLAAALALVVAVTPWIVRCHRVQGAWYFIATGGGRQFFLGNSAHATGSTTDVIYYTPEEQTTLDGLPNDIARERWLYRHSMEFVRRDPGRVAQLYLIKMGNLFAPWPETVTQTLLSRWSRVAQGIASVVVFAGALIALARLRASPAVWPLLGAIVTFALAQAVFHSVMRYRMAIEPCLLWLAGAGWASLAPVASLARRLRIAA
ncbi:MAG: glycosyltransferase family 39 protein [Candidatus Eisenbacteria bacterium]|nr:glycosyltransferase family 39 protein [Candidatus Eisenbacteria bacterium]